MHNQSFSYTLRCKFSRLAEVLGGLLSTEFIKVNGQILMFHHVTCGNVDDSDSSSCSVVKFEKSLIRLKGEGVQFITVDKLLEWLKIKSNDRYVVITFDDATEDMFLNAYPILKRMKIPFIVYVATCFLNRKGFISDKQLEILNNEPLCTIGSHTISHPFLRYSKYANQEIVESKKLLEFKLGKPIEHFAYPFGKWSAVSFRNMKMVKKAGYKSAVGTLETNVFKFYRNFLWYLPRTILR